MKITEKGRDCGKYEQFLSWDNENLTNRNWDERLNQIFDSPLSFSKRVATLKKRTR